VIAVNVGDADATAVNEIERYANDLNTPVVQAPNQAEMLKELPSLARTYRQQNTSNEKTGQGVDSDPSPTNELPVSPVM
jgi:hypothetical protein